MSISISNKAPNEEITIKFSHESIKNFFLVKQIEQECFELNFETISYKNIIEDSVLIKFMAERV